MQKVQIIGNLTKNPEINNGVAKFSVAVNERFKDKQGNQQDRTEFFNCAMFGKSADVAENYFTKGMKIYLEGKMNTNEYEGKKYTTLIVNQFEFLGGGEKATKEVKQNDVEEDLSDYPF